MITEAQLLHTLEPLCKATGESLRRIPLFQNDVLEIDLAGDEERRFKLEVRAYRKSAEGHGVQRSDGSWWEPADHYASRAATGDWISRIPEHFPNGYGKWTVAATDYTALVIHHVWPSDQLVFKTEEARAKFMELIVRFMRQSRSLNVFARYKESGELPEPPAERITHPDYPPMKWQTAALCGFLHAPAACIHSDPGTGKTFTAVDRICTESTQKRLGRIPGLKPTIYRTLVICPRNVRFNWQKEFERFATVPGKVAVLRGSNHTAVRTLYETTRDEADCSWGVVITSVDSVESMLDALTRVVWDLVILDEAHYVKSKHTDRFDALRSLREHGFVRQWVNFTGTPIGNSVADLWSQLELLGPGMSGFNSFENFRKFYGKFVKIDDGSGHAIDKLVAVQNLPVLHERLARIALRVTKEEAGLQLPPKVYDVIEIEMTGPQAKFYRQIRDELAIELEDSDKRMTANHILTQLLRLAQITSGHVRWDRIVDDMDGTELVKGGIEPIPGRNPKLDALEEELKAMEPDEKAIVWAIWKEDIRIIEEMCKRIGLNPVTYYGATTDAQRKVAEDSLNGDPTCRVLIGNPASAGVGLNLLGYNRDDETSTTRVARMFFFSKDWSSLKRTQAEDRAHRRGTRGTLRVTDFVAPGTIDEELLKRVKDKLDLAASAQDVREILKAVLHGEEE